MALTAPNLDDRTFQDFVDDAKRMLQRRIPAWTNHNVHDPGITLIEAVATVADQLTYRLNQLPERHQRKFLDLLGITLLPPTAARCMLTFRLSAARPGAVVVPLGTIAATRRGTGMELVSFTTVEQLIIPSTALSAARAAVASGDDSTVRDLLPDLAARRALPCFATVPQPGDQLLVGLSNPAPRGVILLRVDARIDGIGVDPTRPPLRWQAATSAGWAECEVEQDTTGGLNRPGDITLHLPQGHATRLVNGTRAAWLRAVVTEPARDVPTYSSTPVIRGLSVSCVGASVPAIHADYVDSELLGAAEGAPGQQFAAGRRPLLAHPDPVLEVAESEGGGGWVPWTAVPDFADSGQDDRHYTLDRTGGVVEFGPAVRRADGSVRSYGRVPPEGAMVRLRGYWVGGGSEGNVRAGAVNVLRGSIPFVKSVTNRRPAVGGRDGETMDEAKVRAPKVLRTRDRAVTAEDFELIATLAAQSAARITCLPPATPADPVRVLVVPETAGFGTGRIPLPALQPAAELLTRIAAALDERRVLGVTVVVEPPRYRGITVAVRLRPRRDVAADALREAALTALYTWFHPWRGGAEQTGWPFGRAVTQGDVHAALADVIGIDYVEDVRLFAADPTTGVRGEQTHRVEVDAGSLPFSYDHQVQVR